MTDLRKCRELFPITREWVYLQHASIGPLATPVLNATMNALKSQATQGTESYPAWLEEVEIVRGKVAKLINAKPEEVSFVRNTAEGLGRIALGLRWSPGDNIVTNELEYPTNVLPWLALRDLGVETRIARADESGRVTLDSLAQQVDKNTRLLAISSVQFSNGYLMDLKSISDYCKKRQILLAIDAIQHIGVLPFDVKALGVDFVSAGAHKWLLAPCGSGIFYCRSDLLEQLRVVEVGFAGTSDYSLTDEFLDYSLSFRPSARRFEGGLVAFSVVAGLGAAVDLLLDAGIERIHAHVLGLTDRFAEGIARLGMHLISPRNGVGEKSGIISFFHPTVPSSEIKQRLADRRISVSTRVARGISFVRVSPHFYNTEEEVEQFVEGLSQIRTRGG